MPWTWSSTFVASVKNIARSPRPTVARTLHLSNKAVRKYGTPKIIRFISLPGTRLSIDHLTVVGVQTSSRLYKKTARVSGTSQAYFGFGMSVQATWSLCARDDPIQLPGIQMCKSRPYLQNTQYRLEIATLAGGIRTYQLSCNPSIPMPTPPPRFTAKFTFKLYSCADRFRVTAAPLVY
jgi:hypothetical protein